MNKMLAIILAAIVLTLCMLIPQARKASAQAFYATACFATGLALPGCNLVLPWPPFPIPPIRSTPAPTFSPVVTPSPSPTPSGSPTTTPSPTPIPSPTPTATPANSMAGTNAYAFADAIGINIHLTDGGYTDANKILTYLQYLNLHHVRDGLNAVPGSSYMQTTLGTLATNGIKADLITDPTMTTSTIANDLAFVSASAVDALEGPNEYDTSGDTSWATKDATEQQAIKTYITSSGKSLSIIGPSLGGSSTSYSSLGDLSAYEDYGNMHDYTAGFYPETPGYGGVASPCPTAYGGVDWNICQSKLASVSKPIASTEFGYQVDPTTTNKVDPGAQATYTLRQMFTHLKKGVPKSYIYALYDSGGETYGLLSSATTPRIAFSEIGGFMQIIKDATPLTSNCTVPASIQTTGVSSLGICMSNGQYAIVAWQPVVGWDTNAHTYNSVSTITAALSYSPGFIPTTIREWSYPLNGGWTNASATQTTISVTDRPAVIMLNGPASPTPVPSAPVPTPTPVPTATPTPTPTPTATPAVYANCTLGSFSNPNNLPDTCYRPYAANSVWNMQFSDYTGGSAPSVASSSSTWMSFYTSQSGYFPMQYGFGETSAAGEQYGHPIYFAKSTDPTYTVTCTQGYASSYCPSGSYHIPTIAIPAGGYANDSSGTDGGDHHIAIIDQTTNIELDCWRGQSKTGGVFTADSCSTHSITGSGIHGFETRSGYNLWAGEIREQELIQGLIPHALFLVSPCTNNGVGSTSSTATSSVYPADNNVGTDTLCSGNQGAPYGTWLKLNMTDAQINALGAPLYKKAVYTALAHYGAYIADNNGYNAFGFQVESDYMYTQAGYTNPNCPSNGAACTPLTAYFHSQLADAGWNGNGYTISLSDINWSTYGQWLNPPTQTPPSPAPTIAPTPSSSYSPGPTPTPTASSSPTASPTPLVANLKTYIKNLDLDTVSGMTCPGATPAPDDSGKWSCASGLVGFADTGIKSDNSALHINHMALVIPHVGGYMDISNGCGQSNSDSSGICVPDFNPEHSYFPTVNRNFFATTTAGALVFDNTTDSFSYNQSTSGGSGTGAACGVTPYNYTATTAQNDCTLNPVVPIPTASPFSNQLDPNLQNIRFVANYESGSSYITTVANQVIAAADASYMAATGHSTTSPLNYQFSDDTWDRGDLGGYPDYYSWDNASFNSGHGFSLSQLTGSSGYPYPSYNHNTMLSGLNTVLAGASKPILFNLSGYLPDASGSKNGAAQPAPPSAITACGTNCLGFMQEFTWNNPYQTANQPTQGKTWGSEMNTLIYAQNNNKDFVSFDESGTIPGANFTQAVATGDQAVTVSSLDGIDYGYQLTTTDSNAETVTVTAVYENSFEAVFTKTHANGTSFTIDSSASGSGGLYTRKYEYASEMLAMDNPSLIFNSNQFQLDSFGDGPDSHIPLGIENGLIPANPLKIKPVVWNSGSPTTTGVYSLMDTSQASGTTYACPGAGSPTTGVNCAFVREYANCYFKGTALGSGSFHGCAAVVFPYAGLFPMPTMTQTYTSTVDFTGFDFVQGLASSGTMDTGFYGPPPAGHLVAGPRAYILTP